MKIPFKRNLEIYIDVPLGVYNLWFANKNIEKPTNMFVDEIHSCCDYINSSHIKSCFSCLRECPYLNPTSSFQELLREDYELNYKNYGEKDPIKLLLLIDSQIMNHTVSKSVLYRSIALVRKIINWNKEIEEYYKKGDVALENHLKKVHRFDHFFLSEIDTLLSKISS